MKALFLLISLLGTFAVTQAHATTVTWIEADRAQGPGAISVPGANYIPNFANGLFNPGTPLANGLPGSGFLSDSERIDVFGSLSGGFDRFGVRADDPFSIVLQNLALTETGDMFNLSRLDPNNFSILSTVSFNTFSAPMVILNFAAGEYQFEATHVRTSPGSVTKYDLSFIGGGIAPVPLPASFGFALVGIGMLGGLRRGISRAG